MMNLSNEQVRKMSNFEINYFESLLGKWVNSIMAHFENYLLKTESVRNQSKNEFPSKMIISKVGHLENRSLRK